MEEKTINFPKCQYLRSSCFAYHKGGVCMLLNDTRFKDKDNCPFYKNAEEGKTARSLLLIDFEKALHKQEVAE